MKAILLTLIGALCGAFFSPAHAQEFSWGVHVYQVLDAEQKFLARSLVQRPGYLSAAVLGVSELDMRGTGGTAVGLYGSASARNIGASGQREIVGVYGRLDRTGPTWGAALHGECWDWAAPYTGGTCIGVSLEMKTPSVGTNAIAVNAQADPSARDVVGLQIQETAPEGASNWRRVTRFPAGWHTLGSVDGVEFCARFTGRSQLWQWVRGAPLCDSPDAIVIHEINMNWRPGMPLANR